MNMVIRIGTMKSRIVQDGQPLGFLKSPPESMGDDLDDAPHVMPDVSVSSALDEHNVDDAVDETVQILASVCVCVFKTCLFRPLCIYTRFKMRAMPIVLLFEGQCQP